MIDDLGNNTSQQLKKFNLISIVIIAFSLTITILTNAYADTPAIPQWIKNNAKWWSQGQLADSDFEKGIEYLIDQKIISIPSQNQTTSGAQQIPAWVKNIAGMWADGKISDNDFLKGVEYLVQIGLIQIHTSASATVNTTPTIPMLSSTNVVSLANSTTQSTNTSSANTLQSTQSTNMSPTSSPVSTIPTVPTVTHVTVNATKPSNASATITSTINLSSQTNIDSLVGNGVSLKINGNVASGTLIIAGIRYNAPNLLILEQGNQIQLQGNLQTDDTSMLEAVGVSASGNEYNFYGVISDSGHSTPIKFTALYTNMVSNQSNTSSNQISTTNPTLVLPMLMLYTQPDHVTMGYPYNLAVKIFDPKTNPQKIFDQFNGVISNVNITGTIVSNNQIFSSFSGKTDNQGLYQYQLQTVYYQGWQQTFNVVINASKNGYVPQSTTMSFVTLYPNRGSSAPPCSATIPSAPTGLTATAVPPTQVNLSWTASAGATGYNILRSTTSGSETQVATSTSTTFDDTGLTSSQKYYYEVEATNCAGTSSSSSEVFATP